MVTTKKYGQQMGFRWFHRLKNGGFYYKFSQKNGGLKWGEPIEMTVDTDASIDIYLGYFSYPNWGLINKHWDRWLVQPAKVELLWDVMVAYFSKLDKLCQRMVEC